MINQKKLNKYTAQVVATLIFFGYYDFKIHRKDEYCELDILEIITSPYAYLRIYDDGIVHYYKDGSLLFEGRASRKNVIIKDILNKE